MPPRAIRPAVAAARCSTCPDPVRSWWRSRNSSVIDGGNFGAPPNPPFTASNSPTSACTAASSASVSSPAGGRAAAALSASRAAICPAELRTRAPSSVHACVTAVSRRRKCTVG